MDALGPVQPNVVCEDEGFFVSKVVSYVHSDERQAIAADELSSKKCAQVLVGVFPVRVSAACSISASSRLIGAPNARLSMLNIVLPHPAPIAIDSDNSGFIFTNRHLYSPGLSPSKKVHPFVGAPCMTPVAHVDFLQQKPLRRHCL